MSLAAAFITGHSVRGCTGLSREQRDFQTRSRVPAACWLPWNFPWVETFPFPETFHLLRASVNNVRHYLASRKPAFAEKHRADMERVLSRHDKLLLVAGSCGLELLNNLHLPAELRSRIHVFACGPVSRQRPEVASFFIVQGQHDWLSRWYHPQADARIRCPHMGYLAAPETLRLFDAFYEQIITA